jgi:tetratricopeptide (TPR) repeat protein
MMSGLPKEYDKLVETGNMFMDNRNYPMAAICYRKALELDDSDPGVLVDLGVCLHAVGNSDEAIQMIERAIALDSTHMIAHFNLGVIYRDLNNPDRGKLYWDELIRLYPETPLADTVRKYLNSPGI